MIRLALVIAALWLACTPIPGPAPLPPVDASDAVPFPAPPPGPAVDCSTQPSAPAVACCVFKRYACPEGNSTPNGETCVDVYRDRINFPSLAAITTREITCVSNATSAVAVRKCGAKCGAK
jgi:hypothetical protein